MKVSILRDNGATAFQMGSEGTVFPYDPTDGDSLAVAFTKAVNEGIEKGIEIEGAAAIAVARVLKEAAGTVVWSSEDGYNDLRSDVQNALPDLGKDTYAYVEDISISGSKALLCVSGPSVGEGGGYGSEYYVVSFAVQGDQEVVVDPRANWTSVEREDQFVAKEFVAKAGRMFSGKNLSAMKAAHDALAALIAAGDSSKEESAEKAVISDGPALAYTVQKADTQMRYTLGPLYAPLREDAHGEWIEDDTLHKSLHEFVRSSADEGRRINLQHGDSGDVTVGEWVEAVRWPYEHTIKVRNAAGEEHEVEMPAGTVYLGVVWDEDYWDVEKSAPKGLDGYSLGGRAMKVKGTSEALKSMGYKVQKTALTKAAEAAETAAAEALAIEVGRAAGENTIYKNLTERLIGVLGDHAKTGVTINENAGAGLESLVE